MPAPLAALEPLIGILHTGLPLVGWLPAQNARTITIDRSTDLRIPLLGYYSSGQPIDFANWLIKLTLKHSTDPTVPALVARIGLPAVPPQLNLRNLDLAAGELASMPFGRYLYDVQGRYQGQWYTLVHGGVANLSPNIGVPTDPLTAVSPVVFYVADPPLIAAFDFSGNHLLEVGDSLIDPVFSAAYNAYPGAPTGASISDGINPPLVLSSPYEGPAILNHTYTKTAINASQVFTLTATRPNAPDAEETAQALWQPRVFWGAAAPGVYDEAFIEALSDSALQPSREGAPGFSAGLGEKCYVALPYGASPEDFINDATGFAVGMELVATIDVTNTYGVTLNYDLWATEVAALGALTIRIRGSA